MLRKGELLHISFTNWNDWINRMLAYPGITTQALLRKKIYWFACIIVTWGLLGMTVLTSLLGLQILTIYGVILIIWYVIIILLYCFVKRDLSWLGFATSLFVILVTLLFMFKLGGILHSGGIVFASLSGVLFTIIFQKLRWSVITFTAYAISILVIWILQPVLTPAPEMNGSLNFLIFMLNILWISAFTLAFVVYFIYQSSYYQKKETQRLKELDEVKTKLYTNITHEFRTPLTIILGMAEQMEANPKNWLHEGAEKIRYNGNNLLHMVNQMLDLSKLESGALSLHMTQGDIIFYLKYLLESFHSLAAGKQISLLFESDCEHLLMDYDAEKLSHILSNLLANAIKYTPNGGKVTLFVTTDESNKILIINVKDTGIGIAPEELPYIFDRFFRVENEATLKVGGSGLGLTLTKELVKLLQGNISVQSLPGVGSTFIVQLPIQREAPFETNYNDLLPPLQNTPPIVNDLPIPFHNKRLLHQPVLLIVEDNWDVIYYLMSLLGKDYKIEFALNGQEGLEKAFFIIPDIIISDVMMPVMDGFAMLETLKKDLRTSHIPIVMLTAKADVTSRLAGFERGADAYLAKPFHKAELLVELKKLIELRKALQLRYRSLELPPPTDDKSIQQEDAFMRKVREILEANLSDEDFGILQLCRALGMSRAQLYRKFDTLTNQPVHKYMRNLRLQKAKTLLETTDLNVTEVALEVGFKNLSHFSRSFSEAFGKAPSDLKH